jgi:hypothetical protein
MARKDYSAEARAMPDSMRPMTRVQRGMECSKRLFGINVPFVGKIPIVVAKGIDSLGGQHIVTGPLRYGLHSRLTSESVESRPAE